MYERLAYVCDPLHTRFDYEFLVLLAVSAIVGAFFSAPQREGVYLLAFLTFLLLVIRYWFYVKPFDAKRLIRWILRPVTLTCAIALFRTAADGNWIPLHT